LQLIRRIDTFIRYKPRGKVPNRVGIETTKKSASAIGRPTPSSEKIRKSALLTLVERVTRCTIICKLKNLKAEDTARAAR